MKDIFIGFCLLIVVPSVFEFWRIIIFLEKTKQIDLTNCYKKKKGNFYENFKK